MKKLIFIDNDNKSQAETDVMKIQRQLRSCGGLDDKYIDTIKIIPDFGKMNKDNMYKLLFSNDNCICSWSMYTASHHGSLFQMTSLLRAAGSNEINGICYIDGSGMLEESLERELKNDRKDVLQILNAIETNYILVFDRNEKNVYRLRIDLKGIYKGLFRKEVVDLTEILK